MNEKELREYAVQRYENGESPKQIYESLGKTKPWFFKWLKRFKNGNPNWSKDISRKPHHNPNKTDKTMEQTIIDTRKQLEKQRYSQIGALNILWHLDQKGEDAPSVVTINRIIKRKKLTRKRPRYVSKNIDYPSFNITHSNFLHQLDLVGPRYLKSDGRFYCVNIIDAYDRRCSVNPKRRQNRSDVTSALIRSWQTIGIPMYLQMDNTLANQGSRLHPRAFSLIIRLCLKLGIQPVFIPIREPWRNGIVERFNNVFDKMFFRAQFFHNFDYLCKQAPGFELFHDQNHRYSTMQGKTPNQQASQNIRLLSSGFNIPEKLFIAPGYIHIIRFIRSNRILDIFCEKFSMPMSVEYEYVKATIDTENETLSVYHDSNLIEKYDYILPKTSLDLSKIDI